jgi:hypothetical protein
VPEAENGTRLDEVRERRAGLRRTMTLVEVAAAGALAGRPEQWRVQMLTALDDLVAAWAAHVSGTEGPGGLWEQLRTDAPRLDGNLRRLRREHETLGTEIDGLRRELNAAGDDTSSLMSIRERVITLLMQLARHRQRGADLIYEAYQRDVGGNE